MNRTKPSKPYWKMTTAELAEATKEFDRPVPAGRLKPLSKQQRLRWERARRSASRSVYILDKTEKGHDLAVVRVNSELLRRAHACARDHNLSWEQFVEKSLRSALAVLEMPKSSPTRKSA